MGKNHKNKIKNEYKKHIYNNAQTKNRKKV